MKHKPIHECWCRRIPVPPVPDPEGWDWLAIFIGALIGLATCFGLVAVLE